MATYKESGVDIDAGNESVRRIKGLVKQTFDKNVLTGLGTFGSLYSLQALKDYQDPVLVQSIDGVGTKLKVASLMHKYDTVGIDIVSHSANDILCQGAKPLTFLDYIAANKISPDQIEEILKGMVQGCLEAGMALVGGETAEMPAVYVEGEYDIAGTVTGVVERAKVITGASIKPGDKVLGLSSNGLHTNGYSLARHVLFKLKQHKVTDPVPGLKENLGEALLRPHRCYSKPVLQLLEQFEVKGIAHITGGGLVENPVRILPDNCVIKINKASFPVLPIFQFIQSEGNVPEDDMYRSFNMGIGLVLVVDAKQEQEIKQALEKLIDYSVYSIGEVVSGEKKVELI